MLLCSWCTHAQDKKRTVGNDSILLLFQKIAQATNHNNLAQANHYVQLALQQAVELDNDTITAITYSNVATNYKNLKEYDLAEKYFLKSINAGLKLKDYNNLAAVYTNYGNLFYAKNDRVNQLKYYLKSLEYSKISARPYSVTVPYVNLCEFYLDEKDYDKAIDYGLKGLKAASNSKSFKEYGGFANLYLMRAYLESGDYKNATEQYNAAQLFFEENNSYTNIYGINQIFADYHVKKNQFKEAYKFGKIASSYKSKQLDAQGKQLRESIAKENQFSENIARLELIEKEAVIQKSEKNKLWMIVIFLAVITAMLIFLSVVLKSKNKHLKKLKNDALEFSLQRLKFLSYISHEIRTPIHIIIGNIALIRETYLNNSQIEITNTLTESSSHLLTLVNNVLHFSVSELDKLKLDKTNFNLRMNVQKLLDTLEIIILRNNNRLHLHIDTDVPEYLYSDPLKINQVLSNLISNSSKFNTDTDIYVNINLMSQTDKMYTLEFEVRDDGVGISKKDQLGIFNEFSENSMDINKELEGSGLGLSIVKKIALLMNGEVHVDSDINKGASFKVIVPIEIGETQENLTNESVSDLSAEFFEMKVLVVEDNQLNQQLMTKILNNLEVEHLVVSNGKEAVEAFFNKTNHSFDLILMDVHMPVMNGYEATRAIRSKNIAIPIIAITATDVINSDLTAAGFTDVLTKPYDKTSFIMKLTKHKLTPNSPT